LPAAKQKYLIIVFNICSFFVLPVNLWASWGNPCDSGTNGCKMTVH